MNHPMSLSGPHNFHIWYLKTDTFQQTTHSLGFIIEHNWANFYTTRSQKNISSEQQFIGRARIFHCRNMNYIKRIEKVKFGCCGLYCCFNCEITALLTTEPAALWFLVVEYLPQLRLHLKEFITLYIKVCRVLEINWSWQYNKKTITEKWLHNCGSWWYVYVNKPTVSKFPDMKNKLTQTHCHAHCGLWRVGRQTDIVQQSCNSFNQLHGEYLCSILSCTWPQKQQ